jgi:hypothetical protein
MPSAQHHVANLTNPLGRVRKIQTAQGHRTVVIHKALYPFGASTDGGHLRGCFETPPVEFRLQLVG